MKNITKAGIACIFMLLIAVSFYAGMDIKEQENIRNREQRCNTLILFAINKLEKENLSEQNVREALISNIYAAYEYCDDPALSNQLHTIWNTLIFEDEIYLGKEDALAETLKNIDASLACGIGDE